MSSSPVFIQPLCPLSCGSLLARVHGELRAVVIVKATFALAHGRSAWPIEPERLAVSDRRASASADGALVAATDHLPFLPNCGVTLFGAAHAAGGDAVSAMSVRLAIFRDTRALLDKQLHVYGAAGPQATSPRPFTTMPLTYERAFGGSKVSANPVGVGSEKGSAFASVVDPRNPLQPAGFAPIAPTWAPRSEALRGYVERGGVIEVPEGIPVGALHAAPADQQIDYLRGDEWIVLDGLHASLPRVQTRLPFARAEARYQARDADDALRALPLLADTLVIDAERLVASVTWRGHLPLRDASEAATMRVLVGLELPTAPIRWPRHEPRTAEVPPFSPAMSPSSWPEIPDTTNERDVRAIRAALGMAPAHAPSACAHPTAELDVRSLRAAMLPFTPEPPAASVSSAPEPPPPPPSGEIPPAVPERTVELDVRSLREALPFSPGSAPPEERSTSAPEDDQPPREPITGTVEVDVRALRTAMPWLGADSDKASTASSARALVEAKRSAGESLRDVPLAGVDLSGIDLAGADLRARDLRRARLTGANLSGARLAEADLTDADLSGANLDAADLTRADLTGAILLAASLKNALVEGARLTRICGDRACFVSVRGFGVALARASLREADFTDADLREANLSATTLTSAKFVHANLSDAKLSDARGEDVTFEGAVLERAAAAAAAIPRASLKLTRASGSSWEGATLTGASFHAADLRRANLSRTGCATAIFTGAELQGATLQRITATGADFSTANLTGSDLKQAHLENTVFDEATLRDVQGHLADFSGARLVRADLSRAMLREANFAGADLSSARLVNTDLREAILENANVIGAARQGTKMTGARTRGLIEGESSSSDQRRGSDG